MRKGKGYRLTNQGLAEVMVKLQSSHAGLAAGCRVLEGQLSEDSYVRLRRNRRLLWSGRLCGFHCFAEEGPRASKGQNCELAFDGFDAFQVGDMVEAFETEHLP